MFCKKIAKMTPKEVKDMLMFPSSWIMTHIEAQMIKDKGFFKIIIILFWIVLDLLTLYQGHISMDFCRDESTHVIKCS